MLRPLLLFQRQPLLSFQPSVRPAVGGGGRVFFGNFSQNSSWRKSSDGSGADRSRLLGESPRGAQQQGPGGWSWNFSSSQKKVPRDPLPPPLLPPLLTPPPPFHSPTLPLPQLALVCGAAGVCTLLYVISHTDRCPYTGRTRLIFQSAAADKRQGQRAFAQIKHSAAVYATSR
jgi:hypothetical protein